MARFLTAAIAGVALVASPALAQQPKAPAEWGGLTKVSSTRFDAAYVAPTANFAVYFKVMIDPTEASFRKNWQRDYNNTKVGIEGRMTDEDVRKILADMQTGFQEVFADACREAGYEVVTTPGPDVVRLRATLINLEVDAPDKMTADRTRTFAEDAGEGTLMLEARDSMSGAILGGAIDRREIGDNGGFIIRRTNVENRSDFKRTFKQWAKMSVDALTQLKAAAPIAPRAKG